MKQTIYQHLTIFALRFLLCGAAGLLFAIVNLVLQPFVFTGEAQLIADIPVLLYLPMIPGIIVWHFVSEAMAHSTKFTYLHERIFVVVWAAIMAYWLIADYFPDVKTEFKTYTLIANVLMAWLAVEMSFVLFKLIGVRTKPTKES
jgi:hypothetical protein